MKTRGGCIDPECLHELTWYGAEGSGLCVGYIYDEERQPVCVIIKDRLDVRNIEHMHFGVEDWRLFAVALVSGGIPVPQLVWESSN